MKRNGNERRVFFVGLLATAILSAIVPAAAYEAFRPVTVPTPVVEDVRELPQIDLVPAYHEETATPVTISVPRRSTAREVAPKPKSMHCENREMQMGTYGDKVKICSWI